jgi:hypothetical protein
MRKLNEVRRNDDEFITVAYIDERNYKKFIAKCQEKSHALAW